MEIHKANPGLSLNSLNSVSDYSVSFECMLMDVPLNIHTLYRGLVFLLYFTQELYTNNGVKTMITNNKNVEGFLFNFFYCLP